MVVSHIFYLHPYLGKIPILTSIFFKGGWFKHQPEYHCKRVQDFVDINRLEKVIRFIKVRASRHAELLAAGNRGGCAELWKSFFETMERWIRWCVHRADLCGFFRKSVVLIDYYIIATLNTQT